MKGSFPGSNVLILLLILLFLWGSWGNFFETLGDTQLILSLLFLPFIIDYARDAFGNTWLALCYGAILAYLLLIKNSSAVWLLAALWALNVFKPKSETKRYEPVQYERRYKVETDIM